MNLALHFAAAYNKTQRYCGAVCVSARGSTPLFWQDLGFRISCFLSNRGPFVQPRSFARLFTVVAKATALAFAQLVSLPLLLTLLLPLSSLPSPLLSSLTLSHVSQLLSLPQPAHSSSWGSFDRNARRTYRCSQCST